MSLTTLRLNKKKKNAFLSQCFNFNWLGKYQVDIHFTERVITVICTNFRPIPNGYLIDCVSDFNNCYSFNFQKPKDAIELFKRIVYHMVQDFDVKSDDDFYNFWFDFNRTSGTIEWLPKLHSFLK